MEKVVLQDKDLEAKVSFCFIFEGFIGDFFKARKMLEENLKNSRRIFGQFGSQPYFAANWWDLTQEKQSKIREGKKENESRK